MTSSSKSRQAGFTLFEVLAVLVLMGLMVALVAPRLAGGGGAALASDVRAATSYLRSARQLALAEQRQVPVLFDTASNSISVPDQGASHSFDSELVFEITVPVERRNGDKAEVLFFADGMSSGAQLVLLRAGAKREIIVHWLGGELVAAR